MAAKPWYYGTKYAKDCKYITNTKTLVKNAKIAPKNKVKAGISNLVDKRLHYQLNMSIGNGSYERNTSKFFDRLYSVHPNFELTTTCTYVFFIRPDLNILDKKTNQLISLDNNRKFYTQNGSPDRDQHFRWMNKAHPWVLANLTGTRITGHDFMPILTGRVESINLPDYKIKDYKLTQPYTGYNMPYASHALESMTGGEFEVTFRDDGDMRILKLFQTWLYYINGVTRNMFSPKSAYISNNKTDYCTSVYVITCKPDASEIIHWVKYTGAFPTTAPHSGQSFNRGGGTNNKVSIPFSYFHQEPLNPLSLIDFNKNSHVTKDATKIPYMPIYNTTTVGKIGLKDTRDDTQKKINARAICGTRISTSAYASWGTGSGYVKAPFVCKIDNKYYLRWKPLDLMPK